MGSSRAEKNPSDSKGGLDGAPDTLQGSLVILDPDGRIVATNREWDAFAWANGLRSPGDWVGVDFIDLSRKVGAWGGDSDVMDRIEEVLQDTVDQFEREFCGPDTDDPCWYRMRVCGFHEAGRRRVIVSFLDVSENRAVQQEMGRHESALGKTLARLQLATEAAEIGLWDFDPTTNEVYFSPEWKRQIGYEDHELAGSYETWESLLHPDDREEALQMVDDYLTGRRSDYSVEFRLRHRDGSYRWIHARADIQRDGEGRPLRVYGCHLDVTERKKAEQALRLSEERYRAIFERSQNGILFADTKTRKFRYANPAAARMLGYTQEELCRLGVKDIHPVDTMESVLKKFDAQAKGETRELFGLPCLRKDGKIIYADISATPVSTSEGEFSIGFFTNRTERHRAEASLRESEEKFRNLMEQSPVSIQIHDLDGKLVESNSAYAWLYALSEDALAGLYQKYNVLEDEQAVKMGLMDYIRKPFAGEEVTFPPYLYDGIDTLKTLDIDDSVSRTCWVQTKGFPLRNDRGEVVRAVFLSEDITDVKTAEAALENRNAEFRHLVAQSPLSIQIFNREGFLTQVNPAFMKLWGVADGALPDLLGKWNILEDAEAERRGIQDLIRKAFAGESVMLPAVEYDAASTLEEIGMDGVDGQKRFVQALFYPIKDSTGEVVSVVSVEADITDRRRAENEILRHRERLKELTARMALTEERERRDIAGDLHDQVGQTLALARLELSTLGRRVEDPDLKGKLAEISGTLLQATRDTRNLIQSLSSPTLNELGLAAAVGEFLEDEVGKRHSLRTEFRVVGSAGRVGEDIERLLFRSVRELLLNVVKHARANEVSVHLTQDESMIEIVVRDDGCGFDPTSEARREGHEGGFGLFSVQERMFDMGGELELDSSPGQGCVATLRIPMETVSER